MSERLWVLVLAAGEGSRIRHLTTDADGRSVPKQYASFNGEASMLRQTLHRAERIVPRERVAVVVARQHQAFWARELADLPPWNVIVQPRNRGTGLGLLLGLLHIQMRAPGCGLLVLPSDHHVTDEDVLQECLLRAVEHAAQTRGRPTLLGVTPERAEGGLGWILTAKRVSPNVRDVVGFVEKPEPSVARQLASHGALVNSMILAADGNALLGLFQDAAAPTVRLLRRAPGGERGADRRARRPLRGSSRVRLLPGYPRAGGRTAGGDPRPALRLDGHRHSGPPQPPP